MLISKDSTNRLRFLQVHLPGEEARVKPSVKETSGVAKKKCPLCGASVSHISRHMKSKKHEWRTEDTKYAAAMLGLRKQKGHSEYKRCPIEGCLARVTSLRQHLIKVHKKKDSVAGNSQTDLQRTRI